MALRFSAAESDVIERQVVADKTFRPPDSCSLDDFLSISNTAKILHQNGYKRVCNYAVNNLQQAKQIMIYFFHL